MGAHASLENPHNATYREITMSKLIGLAAVDWVYRCKYMKEIEQSGRRRLEGWETELKNWDPEDEQTMPSGYALSSLRLHLHDLHH
jgi:hypothetical protein